ncbi:MAG TPA: metal ABC transporter substrate-binding protein [Nitrospirota bacterium]|nr:metal ABC transporter substrate-binding protein [Nitrospirota bacterium]
MRRLLLSVSLFITLSTPAFAGVNVVATLPWIGSLAHEIGKDKVNVTVLVKSSQDAHTIEAKPSMILAARKADIIMYDGLDLEIGYLPLIIESSKNPKLMPGKIGNFDCSQFITVLEKPATFDRSMGDVHPLGNPHYHYSPSRVLRVAEGMARLFTDADKVNADFYRANYKAFADRVKAKETEWRAVPLNGKKYVAYHKYFEYLANEFGFRLIGYMEPKPGIPPSAAHIEELVRLMKEEKPDAILVTPAIGKEEAEALSSKTGVKVIVLPNDVGSLEGTDDLISFWDKVVSLLK